MDIFDKFKLKNVDLNSVLEKKYKKIAGQNHI